MSDLRDELLKAMRSKGYTFKQLLEESEIGCDESSLNRKLNGGQALNAPDARALATTLGVKVAEIDRLIRIAEDLGVDARWLPRERVA